MFSMRVKSHGPVSVCVLRLVFGVFWCFIGCGLCVSLGNETAPQPRDFGCPTDYDAIDMIPYDEVVQLLEDDAAQSPEMIGT